MNYDEGGTVMSVSKILLTCLITTQLLLGCNRAKDESVLMADNVVDSEPSYGQLAKQMLDVEFTKLAGELSMLNQNTLPEQTKELRKKIGAVRQMVDVFAYAYEPSGDPDAFLALRDELDVGYEVMGAFKDLFDGQVANGVDPANVTYEPKELKKSREKMLAWSKHFLKPKRLSRHQNFLSSPILDGTADRKSSSLSRFYWGGVDIKPKASHSGKKTISRLVSAQLKESRKLYKDIVDIKDLSKYKDEEAFHDFRKRIRACLQIIGGFDLEVEPDFAPVLVLTDLVSRYGAINDLLISYHKAKGNEARKKMKTINEN